MNHHRESTRTLIHTQAVYILYIYTYCNWDFKRDCACCGPVSWWRFHIAQYAFVDVCSRAWIYIYVCIHLSIYISIYLSVYLSIYFYLSICLSIYLFISISINYIYIYLCLSLSLSISIYPYLSLSIYLPTWNDYSTFQRILHKTSDTLFSRGLHLVMRQEHFVLATFFDAGKRLQRHIKPILQIYVVILIILAKSHGRNLLMYVFPCCKLFDIYQYWHSLGAQFET